MNIEEKKFLQRLKEAIGDESVRNFAKRSGISVSAVQHYLKGGGEPSLSKLKAIAQAANVSVAWLVGETDDPSGIVAKGGTSRSSGDKVVLTPSSTAANMEANSSDLAAAIAQLATIFQSGDQTFIRAIQANLSAFSAAVEKEAIIAGLEKRVAELEAQVAELVRRRDQDGKAVANH